VTRRDLFRDQSKPGAEIALLGEQVAGAGRGHHRARDDRTRIQSFAANFSAVRLNQEFVAATGGGTHVDNSLPLETLSRAFPRARLSLWRDGVHRSLL
jgi:hypothetical protein